MVQIKTVAVIEDISGIGRCAMAVSVPVIAAMGCQPCPLPTALLSAHTAFAGVTPVDNAAFVKQAIDEWMKMDRAFDMAVTGYMLSPECVSEVARFVGWQKAKGCFSIVDPAMADDGKLYRSLNPAIVDSYRSLASLADLITPNFTEASLLAGGGFDIAQTLDRLLDLGAGSVVITGAKIVDGFANVYKKRGGDVAVCRYTQLPARFPGTGDMLAAAIAGQIANGIEPFSALCRATRFVHGAIEATIAAKTDPREGVLFEGELFKLQFPKV